MADPTNSDWIDVGWNPVRGCTKISPGCTHCYAETFSERFRGAKGHPYEQGFDLRLVPHKLAVPLTWKKRRSIFVTSMSDLFQEGVPDGYVADVAEVMRLGSWHNYQVLTKRGERMRDLLNGELGWAAKLEHVWWGVSVEDRKYGVPRIEQLRAIASAKVRFLVLEPLLEDLGPLNLEGIDWVIVGGESGPGARPLQEAWVRSVMEQCRRDGVRFFFKQWGGTRRDKGAPTLDGRTFTESAELRADPIPAEAERRRRLQAAEALAAAWKSRAGTSKLILLPNA